MDELSLLEADTIEEALVADEAISGAVSALKRSPAPDFTGSLEYIDSLASRKSVSLSQRDVANISTGLGALPISDEPLAVSKRPVFAPSDSEVSLMSDLRPLQDRRQFSPEGVLRRVGAKVRSGSDMVAYVRGVNRIATPEHPYSPQEVEEIIRSEGFRKANRHPFARQFRAPDMVYECMKRKIRRQVLHAMGFRGYVPGLKRPRRSWLSRVIC